VAAAAGERLAKLAIPIGAGALTAWIAACLWFPLTDTDIWWHLAAAEWMAQHGAVPRTDPFSVSSLGRPWIDLHWGFQLLARALWSAGGAAALVAGKCAAVAAALFLVLRSHLDRANAWFLIPFAAFGIFHVRFHLDMRPLVVTLLGLGALYAAGQAHLRGRLRHPWAVMLPVQIVLANMQGLYPLGAALVTSLWLGARLDGRRDLRMLGTTSLLLWTAGLATPYGWPGFLLPLTLLVRITPNPGNIFSAEIAENLPLSALARQDPLAALPAAILFLAVIWTWVRAGRRAPTGPLIAFAAFSVLGFMAQRNLPLFLLAALMAAGSNLQVTGGREEASAPAPVPPRLRPWLAPALVMLVAGLYAPRIARAWEYELPGSLLTPFRFPIPAAEFMASHPIPGRLFNELRFGGYLAYRLHPEIRPFVDGRMILRNADFYRAFLDVVDRPEGFRAYAARHGFTHALLPIGEDRRFLPLAAHLLREEGWSLLYCDGAAALIADPAVSNWPPLLLDSLAPGHPALAALEARYGANPRLRAIALQYLEDFLRLSRVAVR
jgi:hypothetical protein